MVRVVRVNREHKALYLERENEMKFEKRKPIEKTCEDCGTPDVEEMRCPCMEMENWSASPKLRKAHREFVLVELLKGV